MIAGEPRRILGGAYHRVLRALADAATRRALGRPGRQLRAPGEVRRYLQHRELIYRYGVSARTVLYIGANVGQDLQVLRAAYPAATLHCFEPQAEIAEQLAAEAARLPAVEVHRVALGDTGGKATLVRSGTHPESSSLRTPGAQMAERFPHVSEWTQAPVDVVRLDDWASARDLADDIVVKMDVQGFEDAVLAGGEDVFGRARIVIAELAVVPTYDGAPEWHVMLTEFLRRGFVYAGELERVHEVTTGAVIEFDAAFARPLGTLA